MLEKIQPYIDLVSDNQNYRRLWLSQVVSNFGDWFGLLAVYALINRYAESALLLGLIIVVKMLSLAFSSPLAGYITDRFNRRRLMIICDGLRALLMLGMLLVVSYQTLWLAYVITALQMILSAIFRPARTSSIPNVTTSDELVEANVLSAASWSVIFALGMGVGGLATAWLGTNLVFIIDAISYMASAWFIYRAVIPQEKMSTDDQQEIQNPFAGIMEGFSFIKQRPHILRPVLAKGCFTVCLGALTYMLVLVSENILLMGSLGVGLLYASRGVGTGIGPVIGRRLFDDETKWIKAMGVSMIVGGLTYAVVGLTESLWVMLVFVFIAHAASGANWVMSTVLLQRRTPDTFRGRTFSTEWLFYTLAQSVSVLVASSILEAKLISLQPLIVIFGVSLGIIGVIWGVTITRQESRFHRKKRRDEEVTNRPAPEQKITA